MRNQLMIASAAAAALMAGAAFAQTDTAVNPPAASQSLPDGVATGNAATAAPGEKANPPDATAPAAQAGPPADTANSVAPAAGAPPERAPASSVDGAPQVITNGPVPDTQENRAKYGKPLSHAGKATKPAGN